MAQHAVDASNAGGIGAAPGIHDQNLAVVSLAEAQDALNPLVGQWAFAQAVAPQLEVDTVDTVDTVDLSVLE
ncbi:MAG: hypothetical protein WBC09_18535 [Thermoanaerobaculia bacterium]